MTLTITLTADPKTKAGVNFNAGYNAFFSDFTPYSFPLFNGPSANRVTQVVHIDTPVPGKEADTKAILVNGDDFEYTFSNHTVSGEINTVRLVTLGAAYNQSTGDLNLTNGTVQKATPHITIAGLDLQNAPGVAGEVHNVIRDFMGGGPSGSKASPASLTPHVWAEGHLVNGSTGADTYAGTTFADTVRGGAGNDILSGMQGNDRIEGGAGKDVLGGGPGNDVITGGVGADRMTGGNGGDVFVYTAAAEGAGDVITDFTRSQGDKIRLTAIDAKTGVAGDQAFSFIGKAGFTKTAGELRYTAANGVTKVLGDVNGDGVADLQFQLSGNLTLAASDFFL